jgi:hypothetical protein
MGVRSHAAALALAALAVGAPRAARAAPSGAASPADVSEARKLFDTGLKLYGESSYREALAAFSRANELAPRASIQRNIAQCLRDLKDFTGAYDAYRALLAKYGATMTAADRRPVERAIGELALLTGTVRVDVREPGAVVSIDGHDAGITPLGAPVRLNLGPHTVTVSKAGFETLQRDVKLSGGDEATIDGPLRPEVTTGHLVVGIANAAAGGGGDGARADTGVEVFVDGTDVGPAPWEGDVKPGVHVVEARGADRLAPPRQVDVPLRDRAVLTLDLMARTGRVQIDTHTTDAAIAIDGQPTAKGVWEGMLAPGQHTLSIEAPGFRTYTRAFLVHEGEAFIEDAHLVPDETSARYEGIYSGLAFLGFTAPGGATNEVAQACPRGASCQASVPLGGGLAVRVGYSFGWIAAEGLALGTYDYTSGTVGYARSDGFGPARDEAYDFHRFGGGGALGVRVANKHPNVRLTGALMGGLVTMGNLYKQVATPRQSSSVTNPSPGPSAPQSASITNTSDIATYVAAMLLAEAGVLVGFANGAKLHASVVMMTQFVGDTVGAGTRGGTLGNTMLSPQNIGVAQGAQIFVGPMVGFDFGL